MGKKILGIGMTQANVPKVMSGEKTQTRRIIKNQPPEGVSIVGPELYAPIKIDKYGEEYPGDDILGVYDPGGEWGAKVNYRPGDVLYVKEALKRCDSGNEKLRDLATYKIDGRPMTAKDGQIRFWESDDGKPWKNKVIPARYMPRSAARTFIEITDVRCERVQDISVVDIEAEGCMLDALEYNANCDKTVALQRRFKELWNDTNGQDAFERNGWVFAYTFKLVEGP